MAIMQAYQRARWLVLTYWDQRLLVTAICLLGICGASINGGWCCGTKVEKASQCFAVDAEH